MKAVIQRVLEAEVSVDGRSVSKIGKGLVTLLAVCVGDTEVQLEKMIDKICGLRIFVDDEGKMNRSLKDVRGEHLMISQFTLAADTQRGKRPSFLKAAEPELARELYEKALDCSRGHGLRTLGGVFQAEMQVRLLNDGPVTFHLET